MKRRPKTTKRANWRREAMAALPQNTSTNYQWSGSDGIICHSHTVAAGRVHANPRQDSTDYAYD